MMNYWRAGTTPSQLWSVAEFGLQEDLRISYHLHHLHLPGPYLSVQCLHDHASGIGHFDFPLSSSDPPG